jgi:HEPN domain-containing protein
MSAETDWANRWLDKAGRDLDSARALFGPPHGLYDMACFHAQQAVEKALKGYLTWRGQTFARLHDLEALLNSCSDLDPEFAAWREDCRILNDYSVAVRYPDDLEDPSQAEAQHAVLASERILDRVRAKLARP